MKEAIKGVALGVGATIAAAFVVISLTALRVLPILGVVIAGILSWEMWHSIPWALVAGMFNWFYVIYYWISY